jgi:acyl carrier protein
MDRSELLEKLLRHIGEFVERDVSHLTLDTKLHAAAPGMDSLKVFELMLYLEESFELEFDESSLPEVQSIGELVDYIEAARIGKIVSASS